MKKLCVLFVVVMLTVASMAVPASAVSYNGYDLSSIEIGEDQPFILVEAYDTLFCMLEVPDSYIMYDGVTFTYVGYDLYKYIDGEWFQQSEYFFGDLNAVMVYNSHDIVDDNGELHKVAMPPLTDGDITAVVLPDIVSGDSLKGTLSEMLSVLPAVIFTVVCFFGIRKGIAFLFSLIRGA